MKIDLLKLRSGEMDFQSFAKKYESKFYAWAKYYFDRYNPRSIDISDLVQEALLEAWRAVDLWDSERGVDIERFVNYRVGERIDREILRVKGWPKSNRSPVAVHIDFSDCIDIAVGTSISDSKRLELDEMVNTFKHPIERYVVAGIGLGASIKVVAAHLYSDSDKRAEFEFDSCEHAIRKVRTVVRKAIVEIEGRSGNTCLQNN
jgi:hypothetical protein